jgi:uncharacterized protein YbjT (DUF2867 family)
MRLITGANRKLGRLIVEEVLRRAPDAPLAVSVRDAGAASDLGERGVDVRPLMRREGQHPLVRLPQGVDGAARRSHAAALPAGFRLLRIAVSALGVPVLRLLK